MSMFKLNDVLSRLISWGVASLFKIRGRQGGGRDSNWRLFIDPCKRVSFLLMAQGGWVSD